MSVSALPGSLFMVGDTNVTYVFADSSGNLATCSFIVTVLTGEKQANSACKCEIQGKLDLSSQKAKEVVFIIDFSRATHVALSWYQFQMI